MREQLRENEIKKVAEATGASLETIYKLNSMGLINISQALDTLILNERHNDSADERILLKKIITSFYTMLKKYGVEPMYDLGARRDIYFNPRTDNAVTSIPTDDKMLDNSIADVIKKGYMYKDQVLRYSMVKVAN